MKNAPINVRIWCSISSPKFPRYHRHFHHTSPRSSSRCHPSSTQHPVPVSAHRRFHPCCSQHQCARSRTTAPGTTEPIRKIRAQSARFPFCLPSPIVPSTCSCQRAIDRCDRDTESTPHYCDDAMPKMRVELNVTIVRIAAIIEGGGSSNTITATTTGSYFR